MQKSFKDSCFCLFWIWEYKMDKFSSSFLLALATGKKCCGLERRLGGWEHLLLIRRTVSNKGDLIPLTSVSIFTHVRLLTHTYTELKVIKGNCKNSWMMHLNVLGNKWWNLRNAFNTESVFPRHSTNHFLVPNLPHFKVFWMKMLPGLPWVLIFHRLQSGVSDPQSTQRQSWMQPNTKP